MLSEEAAWFGFEGHVCEWEVSARKKYFDAIDDHRRRECESIRGKKASQSRENWLTKESVNYSANSIDIVLWKVNSLQAFS